MTANNFQTVCIKNK